MLDDDLLREKMMKCAVETMQNYTIEKLISVHINIFETVRFPLHDHMRKNHGWSPTQVLIKFLMIQILITIGMLGVFFKIR